MRTLGNDFNSPLPKMRRSGLSRDWHRTILSSGLLGFLFLCSTSSLKSQTCTQAMTLRTEACPSGTTSCTSKGSTLTWIELDRDIVNTANLCNGPGKFTWPATGVAGIFAVSSGGVVSVAVDDDTPDSDAEVPDAHTMNGGTLSGTNTVTGILNLDSATEGTLRYPTSTTLPATCTLGDSYWDTDGDTDGSLYVCRTTNTWKEVDDDGGAGGGAPVDPTYLTLGTNATLTNERVFTPGVGLDLTDAGSGSTYTLFFKSSDTLAGNPTLSSEDTLFTKDGTGGGLLFEGVTADAFEGILTWNPTTSDKTVTLPDVSGAIITTGDTSTVTGTMILNDTVALSTDTSGNYAAGDAEAGNATGLVCTTCVDASDIANDAITEAKLKVVDTPADEECFTYESTTGDFEWQTCSVGGGGNSFTTIDTTSGTDPVADSTTDTLQLVEGDRITLTGDSTADSVTVSVRDPLNYVDLYDEFCSRNTTSGITGSLNWSNYGSNTPGSGIATAAHPCLLSMFTTAVSANIQGIGLGKNSNEDYWITASHLDRMVWVIKTDAVITNTEIRVGFMDDVSSTTGGDGFFIEYDSAGSGFWRCITRQGGTATTTASAVTVAINTWYQLEIDQDASGNLRCYVNNAATPFATHSTNKPTGTLNMGLAVQTNDAVSKTVFYDYFRLKGKALGARF